MTDHDLQTSLRCRACGQPLAPGARSCSSCNALVHGAELSFLAQQAAEAEARGAQGEAIELWSRSLTLLPPAASQTSWIHSKLDTLRATNDAQMLEAEPVPDRPWLRKLGPFAPVVLLLIKAKGFLFTLLKLKFLFGFFSFFGLYWALFGWRFGLGLTVSILIHELGHYIDIRRRGLPVEMPVFLPGFGAYVRWNALGVSGVQRAQISLAGPLAGWLAALACAVMYASTGVPLWSALAHTGAMLNLLNLIPVWTLDGSQALEALGKAERIALLVLSIALWITMREGIFFLLTLGFAYRLFTKDRPAEASWPVFGYFAGLMIVLGAVLAHSADMVR